MQSTHTKNAHVMSIYPVLAINFVGSLGFSIVLPFLVYLVNRLGGNAFAYGILGATYSLFQLIGAPVLGRWSDRIGRRRILLLSQFGTLISWCVFLYALYAPSDSILEVDSTIIGAFVLTIPLALLFFARALDGITGGNVSVANAYLADISDDANRNANFGKMSLASNLGFIIGPAISGTLGAFENGEQLSVLAALVISIVAVIMIAFWLPDMRPAVQTTDPSPVSVRRVFGQEQKPCVHIQSSTSLSTWQLLSMPSIALLLSINFLVFLAFNFFYVSFPVYAATGIHWSLTETGIFFSVTSIMMAIVQGPLLSEASRRYPEHVLIIAGGLFLALSFVFFISSSTGLIYTGAVLLAVGNGIMWPSLLSMLAKASGRETQGAVQGLSGSVGAIASIIGLLCGGILYQYMEAGIFIIAAVLTLVTCILSLFISK